MTFTGVSALPRVSRHTSLRLCALRAVVVDFHTNTHLFILYRRALHGLLAAAVAPEPQVIAVCPTEEFPDSQPPPHIDSGALAEGQDCERVRRNWKCGSMATRTPSVDVL